MSVTQRRGQYVPINTRLPAALRARVDAVYAQLSAAVLRHAADSPTAGRPYKHTVTRLYIMHFTSRVLPEKHYIDVSFFSKLPTFFTLFT